MTVSVFPNPASAVINILSSEDASFELMYVQGKVVANGSFIAAYQNHELNTENLANGMYVLKVFNTESVSLSKVSIKK